MYAFEIGKIIHGSIIYTMVLPDAVLQAPAIYDNQRTKMMLSCGKFKGYQKKSVTNETVIEYYAALKCHTNIEPIRTAYCRIYNIA